MAALGWRSRVCAAVGLMFVGLGCFFEAMAYVRRRWPWTVLLLGCSMGMFDLYKSYLKGFSNRFNIYPGGVLGDGLNRLCLQQLWPHRRNHHSPECWPSSVASFSRTSNSATGSARCGAAGPPQRPGRASARRKWPWRNGSANWNSNLRDQASVAAANSTAAVGADGKPLPEPTVRDLSVSQAKAGATRPRKPAAPEPVREPEPPDEALIIPAREVAAATSGDILGKKPPVAAKTEEPKSEVQAVEANDTVKSDLDENAADAASEPETEIAPAILPAAIRPKPAPRRPSPLSWPPRR